MVRFRIPVLAAVALIAVLTTAESARAATVGPPTALVATTGNVQASLAWTAPTVGGNPAISNYVIEYTSDGLSWSQFAHQASTTASIAVTGLTNGTTYTFRVSAVNSDGVGTTSALASTTPLSNHTQNDLPTYSACPTGLISSAGFSDYSSVAVDCVKHYGITKGTTATTYSPHDTVTRWQMALFLSRMAGPAGITLGTGADQGFTDISGYSTEIQTAINQIKQLGITVGKTATTFAPAQKTSREEMALFLSRLLKTATTGPGGNEEYVTGLSGTKEIKSNDTDHNYSDLNTVSLYESIGAISSNWNLGVVDLPVATKYEPLADMTRSSMATMIAGALHHTNARPAGITLQASTYRVGGTPNVKFSVTHRSATFQPIAGTYVDTFKFQHTLVTTTLRFTTAGACSSTVVTSNGGTLCTVDTSDRVTDTSGNLAIFGEDMPTINKVDLWAWTSTTGAVYDNDIHATDASKITVETTAGS